MKRNFARSRYGIVRGLSLVEIIVSVLIVLALGAFAAVSLQNGAEQQDAQRVQAAQTSLQSIVSQGAARMDVEPDQLNPQAVLTAVQATVGRQSGLDASTQFSRIGNLYVVTIQPSKRSATFDIAPTGDVRLIALNNFSNYRVNKSGVVWTIQKGP